MSLLIEPRIDVRLFFSGLVVFEAFLLRALRQTEYWTAAQMTFGLGAVAFWSTYKLLPSFAVKLARRGFCGYDLNKLPPDQVAAIRAGHADAKEELAKVARPIPEAVGLLPAFIYILAGIFGHLLVARDDTVSLNYVSGLLTIVIMTFLGFVDDVIDLRWRYKIVLPFIASLPLLIIYRGPTTIVLPDFIKPFMGRTESIELGFLYHLYMSSLTTFCSNAINIYAGINGLEVGQSMIICACIMISNVLELTKGANNHHLLSFILSTFFLNCASCLYWFNMYPAAVFVGDTFTMLAGVHFGTVCVMGHFAKSVLLFLIPQGLNFIISLPQLFGIVHCPRHRVPHYESKSKLMYASPNWTLINLTLYIFGPMTEKSLTHTLLAFQVLCGVIGIVLRYSDFLVLD